MGNNASSALSAFGKRCYLVLLALCSVLRSVKLVAGELSLLDGLFKGLSPVSLLAVHD